MDLKIFGLLIFCATATVPAISDEVRTTVPAANFQEKTVPALAKFSPKEFKISAPIAIPTPLFADVKNLQDRIFDADAKLRTLVTSPEKLAYASVQAGKDGFFCGNATLPAIEDTLSVFRFFATVSTFTRSKIFLSSPQKFELWINGKKIADKLSVETEIAKSGSTATNFNFEPGRAEILVKVLSQKGSTLPPAVKIEIEPQVAGVPAPIFSDGTEPAPVTIAAVNETERLSGLQLSPDGKYALLFFSKLESDGASKRRVEVRETASGRTVFFDDSSRPLAWMPNGSRLYFRRFDSDDRCAFVEYDFLAKKETVLVDNLPNANCDYYWLPDESGLVSSRTEKWVQESADWTRVLNLSDRAGGFRDRKFLSLVDLKSGVFKPLTAGARSTEFVEISPDSKKIIFATNEVDYSQPEFQRSSYYLLDLKTLAVEPIFENEKYGASFGGWSPDAKKIVVLSGPQAFGGIGLSLPAGVPANSYDVQAFVCDLETKKVEAISKDFNPSISSSNWAGDGNIYFRTDDRDMNNIYRYVPATKKFEKIEIPAESVSVFAVQKKSDGFVPRAYAIASGTISFPCAYAVDLVANRAEKVWTDGLVPAEEKLALPKVFPWKFTASDGTEIDGYYFLPPNFDASKKYPMIVYYYGGTTPTPRVLGSHYPFPLYAAQGYVVYVVQPSGAIGYGQAFSARHVNAWGKRTADDIIEGTKKFCAEHAFVDAKKIGCIGASYGGFMTMYLQTRTDIFAAAVSHAGISDITSYWGEGYWGTGYNAVAAAGSFPWKNKEIFVEQSPLFSADKIKTPLLLCHGAADTNVPVGESYQMFAALKLLGKPVELLTFTGEDHGIMNYTRRKQWIKSHLAWFERWLKNSPDWWNTLYPDKNW